MDIEADDLIIVSGASAALDAEGREKLAAARQTLRQHLRRYKRRMDDDKRTKAAAKIKRALRAFAARKRFERIRKATVKVQQWYRKRRLAIERSGANGPVFMGVRVKVAATVVIWYFFSMSLAMFNKKLLGDDNFHYPAPMFITGIQFGVQYLICLALFRVFPKIAPVPRPVAGPPTGLSRLDFWLQKIAPVGVAIGADIALSNLSLVHITVTLYTMCKSTSPVFVLFFAIVLGMERMSWTLIGVIGLISTGVVLAVMGEGRSFSGMGFILVMLAATASGLRWTLTQYYIMDLRHDGSPVATLSALLPTMCGFVVLCSLFVETPWQETYFLSDTFGGACVMSLIVILGALMALAMTVAEFQFLADTSAVTVSVAGVCKEVLTIMVSALLYGDHLGALNLLGLLLVSIGVGVYNLMRRGALKGHAPMLTGAALQRAGSGTGGRSPAPRPVKRRGEGGQYELLEDGLSGEDLDGKVGSLSNVHTGIELHPQVRRGPGVSPAGAIHSGGAAAPPAQSARRSLHDFGNGAPPRGEGEEGTASPGGCGSGGASPPSGAQPEGNGELLAGRRLGADGDSLAVGSDPPGVSPSGSSSGSAVSARRASAGGKRRSRDDGGPSPVLAVSEITRRVGGGGGAVGGGGAGGGLAGAAGKQGDYERLLMGVISKTR